MTLLVCRSKFIEAQSQPEPISPFHFLKNVSNKKIRGCRKWAGQLILDSRFSQEWALGMVRLVWLFTGSPTPLFLWTDASADLETAYFILTSEILLTWEETTLPSTTSSMMVFVTLVLLGSENHGTERSVWKWSLRPRAGERKSVLADCALCLRYWQQLCTF